MAVDPLAAEVRAIEAGRIARLQKDGTFLVRCGHPEEHRVRSHRVGVERLDYADGSQALRFRCDCPSGEGRPSEFVPCYHAAAVGRRLEREGRAEWIAGTWFARADLMAYDHDEPIGPVVDLWVRDG